MGLQSWCPVFSSIVKSIYITCKLISYRGQIIYHQEPNQVDAILYSQHEKPIGLFEPISYGNLDWFISLQSFTRRVLKLHTLGEDNLSPSSLYGIFILRHVTCITKSNKDERAIMQRGMKSRKTINWGWKEQKEIKKKVVSSFAFTKAYQYELSQKIQI